MSSKRSLSPNEGHDESSKRAKLELTVETESSEGVVGAVAFPNIAEESIAFESVAPTRHAHARIGIQRSIGMVLEHDGFSSATPEALESFTGLVESYFESIVEETKRLAMSSRRDHPIPTDFEAVLARFNLPISSLKPHLRNPISAEQLAPTYELLEPADEDAHATLPLLGEELSGKDDKTARAYVPKSFPDFPSQHTYRFTPQEDSNTRDFKKIREEAARSAQQGEDALRRLVRASKMRKQKEAKALVETDVLGKERFRQWEATMRRFMNADGRGENTDQLEIAEHSMIVNGDAAFSRKEVSRLGKRPGQAATKS